MVSSPANPHRPPVHPSTPQRTQPRRPARDRRREALQGEREGRAAGQPRVDREVRRRLVWLSSEGLSISTFNSGPWGGREEGMCEGCTIEGSSLV